LAFVSIQNLSKTYPAPFPRLKRFLRLAVKPPVVALKNVSFDIAEGEIFGLIGRNGAGKTTLLKCVAGAIDTDVGRRTIVPGTRVVLLEQNPDMAAFASLRDYAMAGRDAPAAHEVDAIADQIGIDLDRPAATASGGERRRAAIARALAQDPDVL